NTSLPAKHAATADLPALPLGAAKCAAQRRPRADLDLSSYAVAAHRLQLPASADLLAIQRRGAAPLRPVGGRLDDAGAAVALSAMGHIRHRQCAAQVA